MLHVDEGMTDIRDRQLSNDCMFTTSHKNHWDASFST